MEKILLVDDTVTVVMSERLLLNGQGFDIATAYNGAEALEKVKNDPPDLILCDMLMPIMGGIEFLSALRNISKFRNIPVIMVTTQGNALQMKECFEAGCNDFVTKPINKKEILAKIKRHLVPRLYKKRVAVAQL
jgi:CheY-like chemotaxis protein